MIVLYVVPIIAQRSVFSTWNTIICVFGLVVFTLHYLSGSRQVSRNFPEFLEATTIEFFISLAFPLPTYNSNDPYFSTVVVKRSQILSFFRASLPSGEVRTEQWPD